jgi:hypothetical protein
MYANVGQQQTCSRRAIMTSSAYFTKPLLSYKKTEQEVGDNVPTPMNTMATVF